VKLLSTCYLDSFYFSYRIMFVLPKNNLNQNCDRPICSCVHNESIPPIRIDDKMLLGGGGGENILYLTALLIRLSVLDFALIQIVV